MSNYNSQLQSNNTDLQEVLQALQTKAAGTNTSDATAEATDILFGETAYVKNGKVVGTMPNNGAISLTMDGINIKNITVPGGYTSGGTVSLDDTIDNEVDEQADLIAQIKNTVNSLPEAGGAEENGSFPYTITVNTFGITGVSPEICYGNDGKSIAIITHTNDGGGHEADWSYENCYLVTNGTSINSSTHVGDYAIFTNFTGNATITITWTVSEDV